MLATRRVEEVTRLPSGKMARLSASRQAFHCGAPLESSAGYTISHSSHIYLIDTIGRVRATFGEGVPVGRIAETVHRLAVAPIELAGGEA